MKKLKVSEELFTLVKLILTNHKQVSEFSSLDKNEKIWILISICRIQCLRGVLGPFLFLLFINDLAQHLEPFILSLFADDSIIYVFEDIYLIRFENL